MIVFKTIVISPIIDLALGSMLLRQGPLTRLSSVLSVTRIQINYGMMHRRRKLSSLQTAGAVSLTNVTAQQ